MSDKITPDRKSILANIRVQRFTPGEHKSPYYDNFKVNVETGMTVLEVLRLIKNTQDSSLTFRAFCRSKICGSCAVRVNNKPLLACSTQLMPILEDFKQESVTIQPMRNMPVLRDLVVDIDPVIEKLAKMHPYLMENHERIPETLDQESLMSKEEFGRFDYITDCVLCGSCYSACSAASADPGYAGPLTLGKAYRYSADVRDSFQGERMQAAVDQGLWSCAQCRKCVEQCAHHVELPAMMRSYMYAYGYRDLAKAKNAVRHLDLTPPACQSCDPCTVTDCTMGFNVKKKVLDIARIASVPDDFIG